ncbi:hypothetical protein HL033_03380 [Neoehrlichia mikurensis]|uniref:Uncharacterized protein n=1 Tax=Neoehrlichia mikurensis TaxID=89586 RepID=A0A9Q9F3Y6_9RICK|nr:hypothetical protein [Neoehrlichia mikurensis]QXK91778.1 hypothetical protein IAH97_03375 [Neoehrlichia mikurensis]QXK92991.1 hypothetical protein HUN61_03370 [Neoehrlichia mikurensis]QXK93468.1 hypothetical protein HL033_03380 [Neoehrlichia mikurensis]UTO55577.1 hypothetical protein LUA82_00575 [Neoehrlichia mikurensis]UTO56498.1 hypothetical protein LUA81_00575 [Neoehrlichia mikurensis]
MDTDILNSYEYCNTYNIDYFDDLESNELLGEQKRYNSLWEAVILQAMIDLTSNYKRTENKLEKIKAFNWINDLHDDFITVCYFTGYSPIYVRNKARKIMFKGLNSCSK